MTVPSANLGPNEFEVLGRLIHERFGLLIKRDRRTWLQGRLAPRLARLGLHSFREYLALLTVPGSGSRELARMAALLVNHETYFLREFPQLAAFRDFLLPEIRSRKLARGDRTIRIVSAGCASGEEAYSLAMMVYETGSFFWGWNVDIIGLDLSEPALETARRAVYYPRSFRCMAPELRVRFFTRQGETLAVKDSLRRMTRFQAANIATPGELDRLGPIDFLFCRNVLIYFSRQTAATAVKNFRRALNCEGCLFLGHSESLNGWSEGFEPVRFAETVIYRKTCDPDDAVSQKDLCTGSG